MKQQQFQVISNQQLKGEYWRIAITAPELCAQARPGQFVHLQIPGMEAHILRRPFSICNAEDGVLTLVYKRVGVGSRALSQVQPGAWLDILGALGKGFTIPEDTKRVLMLGGGYGCAAMYFFARVCAQAGNPPVVMLGARSSGDILLEEEFRSLGCQVLISTDDGSAGVTGRITLLLESALKDSTQESAPWIAACGPMPMLKAVAAMSEEHSGAFCEVSLDEIMCCGVGACFGCVVKCKADNENGWVYRRSCHDGPVFDAREVWWG